MTLRQFDCLQVYYDSRGENGGNPPLEFDTGVDFVPEAVDMCIRLMTPNELATVSSTPRYAYEGRKDKPPVSCTTIRNWSIEILNLNCQNSSN